MAKKANPTKYAITATTKWKGVPASRQDVYQLEIFAYSKAAAIADAKPMVWLMGYDRLSGGLAWQAEAIA